MGGAGAEFFYFNIDPSQIDVLRVFQFFDILSNRERVQTLCSLCIYNPCAYYIKKCACNG